MNSHSDDAVTLREITAETVLPVTRLAVAPHQTRFVAPNAISLAQALFAREAWYRAIHRGDQLVGFVMLADDSLLDSPPEAPAIAVWRLMVDAAYQRQGIGRAAMRQVIEYAKNRGRFSVLELSYVPGPNSPERFYLSLGFRHTGRMNDGEVVLELPLDAPASVESAAMPTPA